MTEVRFLPPAAKFLKKLKDKKLKQLYKEAIGRRGWWEMPLSALSGPHQSG